MHACIASFKFPYISRNHINIIILHHSRRRLTCCSPIRLLLFPSPIIFHLLIQLILRLSWPSIHHSRSPFPFPFPIPILPPTTPHSPPHRASIPANRTPAPGAPRPASSSSATVCRGDISIYALWGRLSDVRPPRGTWTSAATSSYSSTVWFFDALEEAAARLDGCVEGVARCCSSAAHQIYAWSCGQEGQTNGLAGCICSVIFADGAVGGGDAGVCHKCCAGGATCAVEAYGDGGHGGDASEKVLMGMGVSRVWLEQG